MSNQTGSSDDRHSHSDELHWRQLLFLTQIPEELKTSAWQERMTDGIRALSPEIDRVVLNINRNVNLFDPESNRYGMTFRRNISTTEGSSGNPPSGPTIHYSSSLPNDVTWPIHEHVLADVVREGFPSDRYHPPFGIDLRIGSEGYLGSILVFARRSGSPLTENTDRIDDSLPGARIPSPYPCLPAYGGGPSA